MNIIKKRIFLVVLTVGMAGSAFAANPADLTVFDRFYPDGYIKLIYGEDSKITSFRLPAFKNDFSLFFQSWENREGDCKKYTGRLIKRFSPFFDAAIVGDTVWKSRNSNASTRTVFDLHGDFFGSPAGIGFSLPFDKKDDIKIGSRISFGDFTTYLTVCERDQCRFGVGYIKDGMKLEVAYDREDIWYFRVSKGFKTSFGKVFPEFGIRFTRGEQFISIGIGFAF